MAGIIANLDISDVLVSLIAGFFGLAVAKATRQSPPPVGSSMVADHAQQIVHQMEVWTDKRLAEQDEWMNRQLGERDKKITALGKRVESLERRYRAALDFIRRVIQRHPETSVEVPEEIQDDLNLL